MTPWVVNASPLILLGKIGRLDILARICPTFVVPAAVATEVAAGPSRDPARQWMKSKEGQEHVVDDTPAQPDVLAWGLGFGETAVISHAIAHAGSVAALDDLAARTCAGSYGLSVIGSLGLLLKAKDLSLIAALKPEIQRLMKVGSQLHPALVQKALALAGEG